MLKKLVWCAAFCLGLAPTLRAGTPMTVAQAVLDRLYATNGNYKFKKPKLVITNENKKVAAYVPWKNNILLDEKAYHICQSFGRDSLAALAFMLGHELVHAFQSEIRGGRVQTNFLAYNRSYSADVRLEKVADIQGLFNAYLAGYGVLKIMPDLIGRIYEDYDLTGKTLPGYPSLEERKASCEEVLAIADDLRELFESCNYLLVIGQNTLASSGYEYILQYYQGLEIYNNLGLAYTRIAQQFWNPQTDRFIYPMEADWYSKLARSARGPVSMDPTEQPLRGAFLEKAVDNFRMAAQLDPNYLPARINMVCALNLMGKPVEALKYAEMNLLKVIDGHKNGRKPEPEMAELALGITYALQPGEGRKSEAAAIFKRLSASQYVMSALYGQQNLQALLGITDANVLTSLPLPEGFRLLVHQMELGRTSDLKRIPMDPAAGIYFARKREFDSATIVFSNDRGNLVSLLRFRDRTMAKASILAPEDDLNAAAYRNIMAAKDGFYIHEPNDRVVVKVSAKGQVLEMVKYVIHG